MEDLIINIILDNDFFEETTKNEIKNFKNWGYKIISAIIEREIIKINNDIYEYELKTTFNPKLILIWNSKDKTIISLNRNNNTFDLLNEIQLFRKEAKL